MPGDSAGLAAGPAIHVVRFYGDDGELRACVSDFLGEGLADGCPAIVVATPAHRAVSGAALGERAGDGAAQAGRLVMVDAAGMLDGFLAGGRVDPARFRAAASDLITRAGGAGQPVRIYAEMVALLWDAGQVTLALELEALWNDLAARLPFSLLCGYPARLAAGADDADALEQVCRLHSAVLGASPAAGEPGGIRVVTLPAWIDPDNAGQVRAELAGGLAPGVTVLVADMTATTWCSLEGVQVLVRARRAAEAAGAQLRLAAVRPEVRRVLDRTGTGSLLRLYPTLAAAQGGEEHHAPGLASTDTPKAPGSLPPVGGAAVTVAVCGGAAPCETVIGHHKTDMGEGQPVLRSKDPAGVEQEMWALFAVYQAICTITGTGAAAAGIPPNKISFLHALAAATDTVAAFPPEQADLAFATFLLKILHRPRSSTAGRTGPASARPRNPATSRPASSASPASPMSSAESSFTCSAHTRSLNARPLGHPGTGSRARPGAVMTCSLSCPAFSGQGICG